MLRSLAGSDVPAALSPGALDGGGVHVPVRSRLLERLGEAAATVAGAQRLTVLGAPAGYGKTATVAAWLGGGGGARQGRVRWVRCVPSDPGAVWSSLRQELASVSATPVAPGDGGDDPSRATLRIAAGITSPLTVVVDDYHESTSAESDAAIAELAVASPLLRVVVAGRRVTLLDGPLVSAKIRVLRIGPADLALTPAETEQFIAALGVPAGERLATALERADGWPLAIGAALSLGSDELYRDTAAGRSWIGSPAASELDPVANLAAFALHTLQVVGPAARRALLAATQLDAISLAQLTRVLDAGADAALAAAQQLVELGLLVPGPAPRAAEFGCHRSVRAALSDVAARTMTPAQLTQLHSDRAAELERTAPVAAFRLYCAAGRYDAAETVLARNFTVITDDAAGTTTQLLRAVPEQALLAHPTLTAALLVLESPSAEATADTLEYLLGLWRQGLRGRLPEGAATAPGPLHLPLLFQAMVANRLAGRLEESHALMRQLESRLTANRPDDADAAHERPPAPAVSTLSGFLPFYYREAAAVAVRTGDLEDARRNLQRLRHWSEHLIATSSRRASESATPADSGSGPGEGWLLAALSGLAFVDFMDGDLRGCADTLAELDDRGARTGAAAHGLSWVWAEIARAHLSSELRDEAMLERATTRLSPLARRLESWPLLVVAQAASVRNVRPTCSALAQLRAGLAEIQDAPRPSRGWSEDVAGFEIMLCTSLGDIPAAAALLDGGPSDSTLLRLERARLALFSGDDVEALLIAQHVGLPGTTKRQRTHRFLISAVAAWSCGRRDDAFFMLGEAAGLLTRYRLPSTLQSVPYEPLRELADAAREAGVCDLVDLVAQVPEPARAKRYGRLTEMELRTLRSIAQHRSANKVAAELFVTAGTVKKHLASVYRKLWVNGRDEAIMQAGRMGILG